MGGRRRNTADNQDVVVATPLGDNTNFLLEAENTRPSQTARSSFVGRIASSFMGGRRRNTADNQDVVVATPLGDNTNFLLEAEVVEGPHTLREAQEEMSQIEIQEHQFKLVSCMLRNMFNTNLQCHTSY